MNTNASPGEAVLGPCSNGEARLRRDMFQYQGLQKLNKPHL